MQRRRWGAPLLLISLGMLIYCTVFSIGVFAAQNNPAATVWFVVVSTSTLVGGALLVQDVANGGRARSSETSASSAVVG